MSNTTTTDDILFHKMAEKMYELAVDGNLVPTKKDLSLLLEVLALHVEGSVACAALELASGELSNDMGWFILERGDSLSMLEETLMPECGYHYFETDSDDSDIVGWIKSC